MGSRGKLLFDLNEPPAEEVEENESAFCFQPQRAVPSSSAHTSDLFTSSTSSQRIVNNHAFSHASSVSGFQPFIRSKGAQSEVFVEQKRTEDMNSVAVSSNPINGDGVVAVSQLDLDSGNPQVVEKEEGEWSDAEGSTDAYNYNNLHQRPTTDNNKAADEKGVGNSISQNNSDVAAVNNSWNVEGVKCESNNISTLGLDADTSNRKSFGSRNSEGSCKGDVTMDGQEDSGLLSKQKDIKGVEASHALKLANNPVKRLKVDQQKEAMLGKKRSRQTMFLNLEDVKQAGPIKTSTPRRQNFPAPVTTRIVKETTRPLPASSERTGEKQLQPAMKDSKQVELSCNEGNDYVESNDPKTECNGDMNSGLLARPRRLNSSMDLASEDQPTAVSRQSSWKQPLDSKQLRNTPVPGRKPAIVGQNSIDLKSGAKKLPSKKPPAVTNQYQDTSVERLLREVTNEKFWHHPGSRIAEGIPTAPCGGLPTLRRACWMEENYSHKSINESVVVSCSHFLC